MRTTYFTTLTTAILVSFLAPSVANAQPLADRVPPDAIVYVGWGGSREMGPGYEDSHLKAVMDASNLRQLVDEFLPQVLQRLGQEEPDAAAAAGMTMALLQPMWEHPSALFFAGVDFGNNPNAPPTPRGAIFCRAGEDAAELRQQLQQLLKGAADAPFPVRLIDEGDIVGIAIGYAEGEPVLVAGGGGGAEDVGGAVGPEEGGGKGKAKGKKGKGKDKSKGKAGKGKAEGKAKAGKANGGAAPAGGGGGSLIDSEKFRSAMSQLGGGEGRERPVAAVYLDVEAILAIVDRAAGGPVAAGGGAAPPARGDEGQIIGGVNGGNGADLLVPAPGGAPRPPGARPAPGRPGAPGGPGAGPGGPGGPPSWQQVRDALGIDGLKRVLLTAGFDGKEWGCRAFIEAPAPRRGLLSLMDAEPLSDDVYRLIPQTATMAGAARVDLSRILEQIRAMVGELEPRAVQELDQGLAEISKAVGVDVEKELLASLGDEWAYFIDPEIAGQGTMGVTVVNRLRDAAAFERAMGGLEDAVNKMLEEEMKGEGVRIAFRRATIDDLEVHFLGLPLVTPAWAVKDGNLIVGLYPQVVTGAAARIGAEGGGSILDNEGFATLRDQLGGGGATAMSYMDLPRLVPHTYGSWMAVSRVVGFADLFGIDSPPIVLPPLNVLSSHLAPAMAAAWSDDNGWHYRSRQPFPASTMFASDPLSLGGLQTAVGASVLLPSLNRAREQANRVKSASNLRQIGMGSLMYANEQKGKLPASLAEIARTQDVTADIFINPRGMSPPPPPEVQAARGGDEALAKWVEENSDYVWVGAGKNVAQTGPEVVVAYENPAGMTDGINVLFGDGHVEFIMMDQALQMIEQAGGGGGAGQKPKPEDGL